MLMRRSMVSMRHPTPKFGAQKTSVMVLEEVVESGSAELVLPPVLPRPPHPSNIIINRCPSSDDTFIHNVSFVGRNGQQDPGLRSSLILFGSELAM
ncbi:hypothetical protein Tco_1507799 [Tanacetum coccineum]